MDIIFFSNTPLSINSFLNSFNMVDFPERLIPVITFIICLSLYALSLFIYSSRYIIFSLILKSHLFLVSLECTRSYES